MSSGSAGRSTFSSTGSDWPSGILSNMLSKSVRNMEKTGAGMLSVGAKTMPTFLIVILFTSELLTMIIKNCTSARSKARFGRGSL